MQKLRERESVMKRDDLGTACKGHELTSSRPGSSQSGISIKLEKSNITSIDQRVNHLVNKKLMLMKEHLSSKKHLNRSMFAMKAVAIDA